MTKHNKQISVSATPALEKIAKAFAKDNGMTLSGLYDEALRFYLKGAGLKLDEPSAWGGKRLKVQPTRLVCTNGSYGYTTVGGEIVLEEQPTNEPCRNKSVDELSREADQRYIEAVANAAIRNPAPPIDESSLSDDKFCPYCRGNEAEEYRGIDGKLHIKCPKCGIIE